MPPTLVVHPWDTVIDDNMGLHYIAPGIVTGLIDYRSNTDRSNMAGDGVGFFAIKDGESLPSGTLNLGSDLEAFLTISQVNGLNRIGIAARTSDKIVGMIRGAYLNPVNYDATGVDKCKPLRGSKRNGVKIRLNGFGDNGLIISERFTPDHVALTSTLAVRHVDYRRNRQLPNTLSGNEKARWIQSFRTKAERVGQETLTEEQARERWLTVMRKWNNYDSIKLFGRNFDSRVLPNGEPEDEEYTDEGWEQRTTRLTEGFNTADPDTLGADQTWAEDVASTGADVDVVSNQAKGISGAPRNRAEADVSTDDHSTQLDLTTIAAGGTGPNCRFSPSADTSYHYTAIDNEEITHRLFEITASTASLLDTHVGDIPTVTAVLKLTVVDSSQEGFDGATSRVVGTDTAITGNVRGGFNIGADAIIDDWQVEDEAVGTTLSQVERHYPRGSTRGVLRGAIR